ncbi:hypothetical protein BDY24DRAFT_399306 [Mrakia frigida]|uniref:uncharacterized protein n=1 Tax=Mrakia frigida TaxID=29902 RepID=UPI003FCC1FA9
MVSAPTRQRPSNPPTYSPSASSPLLPPHYSPSPSSQSPRLVPTSSLPSSSASSPATSPSHESDAIVPAFPLIDALAGSPNSRHLPHLVASTLSLTLTKSSVQVVLAQNVVFVSPPKKDDYGLGLGDYGLEGDDTGKDARINGFVNVVAPHRKWVKGISMRLVGSQRLIWPRDALTSTSWYDEEFFSRDLLFEGDGSGKEKGLWLEKGVNTWEFSFCLPSTSPASDRSESGWIEYRVYTTVLGSGGYLKSDLTDSKKMVVVCSPPRDDNVHQLQIHTENVHPQLGPLSFDLSSNELVVGGCLVFSLVLVAPPPSLAVFAIQSYIVQTTTITSNRDRTKTAVKKSTKKWVLREGARGGWTLPNFAATSRAQGVILDGSKVDLGEGQVWKWSKAGRLPDEAHIAPTSLPGTETSLRYSNELFVEVIFNQSGPGIVDEGVKIAPLFQRPLVVASCCCMLLQLHLPNYAEREPATKQRPRRRDGWFVPFLFLSSLFPIDLTAEPSYDYFNQYRMPM